MQDRMKACMHSYAHSAITRGALITFVTTTTKAVKRYQIRMLFAVVEVDFRVDLVTDDGKTIHFAGWVQFRFIFSESVTEANISHDRSLRLIPVSLRRCHRKTHGSLDRRKPKPTQEANRASCLARNLPVEKDFSSSIL